MTKKTEPQDLPGRTKTGRYEPDRAPDDLEDGDEKRRARKKLAKFDDLVQRV